MVVSAARNDYSLPKVGSTFGLGIKSGLLTERSMATTMAFEDHREEIINPRNYINPNRLDHVTDGVLMPNEVFPNGRPML